MNVDDYYHYEYEASADGLSPLPTLLKGCSTQSQPVENCKEMIAFGDDSPMNSLDSEDNNLDIYAVTPPSNARAIRREKEKNIRSKKPCSFREIRDRPRCPRNALSDPGFKNISIEKLKDEILVFGTREDELDNKMPRRCKKSSTRRRSRERDIKSQIGDIGPISLSPDNSVNLSDIKVDSHNRFLSLNSKQVTSKLLSQSLPGSVLQSILTKRQLSTSGHQECPVERLDFFKSFSDMVNSGNSTKQLTSQLRQRSDDEQTVWQNKLHDLVWLELKGWHAGMSMSDIDQFILTNRQTVPEILNEVLYFRVNEDLNDEKCSDNSDYKDSVENFHFEMENDSFNYSSNEDYCDLVNEDRSQSFDLPERTKDSYRLSQHFIDQQQKALLHVTALLQKVEAVEALYPTYRAIGKDHPMYTSENYQHRVDMLCTWLNITKDLIHKLRLMASVVGIVHCKHYDWPWLEGPNQYDVNCKSSQSSSCSSCNDSWSPQVSGLQSPDILAKDCKSVRFSPSVENLHSMTGPSHHDQCYKANLKPGDTSTPIKGIPRSASEVSLEDASKVSKASVYHNFVDKTLKKMGMTKLLLRIHDLLDSSLQRAKDILENHPFPGSLIPGNIRSTGTVDENILSSSPSLATSPSLINPESAQLPPFSFPQNKFLPESLLTASEEFVKMDLPSFRPCYLFLVRIPLDIIHECLRLRLEQCPKIEPSILSIRQLISEFKEALNGAMLVKAYYKQMVISVVWDDPGIEERLINTDLESFDADMRHMLDVYFTYIQTWMSMVQNLPEASRSLKNALENEWAFTKKICPYVRGGEAEAGKRFCFMATDLLQSIADFLDQGIDEYTTHLFDRTTSSVEEVEGSDSNSSRFSELRTAIIHTCREFKVLFNEARERAAKALGFAKMLKNDLEIAADFNVSVTQIELSRRLKETNHVKVLVPHSSAYQMFIPDSIDGNSTLLQQLLSATCGHETMPSSNDVMIRDEGYLLLVRTDSYIDRTHPMESLWTGKTITVGTTAEITIALSHIEVESLLLVVIHSSQLTMQRKEFEKAMHSTVELINEQTSCHQAISESMAELKLEALELRKKIADAILQIDEKLSMDEESIYNIYTETLHQCYRLGFEYHKEITRLITGESQKKMARGQVSFAKQWMRFVMEKCESGRGNRPRWSNPGLEFLTIASSPRVTSYLHDEDFLDFKNMIEKCYSHLLGSAEKKLPISLSTGNIGYRVSSPDFLLQQQKLVIRTQSMVDNNITKMNRSLSTRSTQSEPTPPHRHSVDFGVPSIRLVLTDENGLSQRKYSISELPAEISVTDGADDGSIMDVNAIEREAYENDPCSFDEGSPKSKVLRRIQKLEQKRQLYLMEQKIIGKVTSLRHGLDVRISVKRANFKWQRGIKVGEGQFGKVYTAVNIGTGELMALKEISFQPNDHKTMKDIADEIRNFEGIQHPNLVRYYGVEVHKDEIMIFMEFCDGGTIEEAAKAGLAELLIRKYTKEILVAISVLHDHGIVHRDIKGNNIFLLTSGQLKLGDFGCAAKLRNHTTIPGEFNSMVGTTAYMAPELYTSAKNTGHGRAADIWSLGCVVIEMATGKRPWHELDNDYQIMFKVGMGNTPQIPENLSSEGRNFISQCLQHDPNARSTASQLQDHPFVKIAEDDFD